MIAAQTKETGTKENVKLSGPVLETQVVNMLQVVSVFHLFFTCFLAYLTWLKNMSDMLTGMWDEI